MRAYTLYSFEQKWELAIAWVTMSDSEMFEDSEYDWTQTAYGQRNGVRTEEDVIKKRVSILRAYMDKGTNKGAVKQSSMQRMKSESEILPLSPIKNQLPVKKFGKPPCAGMSVSLV